MDWTHVVTSLASLVTAGGLAKLYSVWKKRGHEDRAFLLEEYRRILKDEQEISEERRQRLLSLEKSLSNAKIAMTESVAENIILKAKVASYEHGEVPSPGR